MCGLYSFIFWPHKKVYGLIFFCITVNQFVFHCNCLWFPFLIRSSASHSILNSIYSLKINFESINSIIIGHHTIHSFLCESGVLFLQRSSITQHPLSCSETKIDWSSCCWFRFSTNEKKVVKYPLVSLDCPQNDNEIRKGYLLLIAHHYHIDVNWIAFMHCKYFKNSNKVWFDKQQDFFLLLELIKQLINSRKIHTTLI